VSRAAGPPFLDRWADFRGNFQYISIGSVLAVEPVALLLMDPSRQRLKMFGTLGRSAPRTSPS